MQRRVEVYVDDGARRLFGINDDDVGATTRLTWPNPIATIRNNVGFPIPLEPGWRIVFVFVAGGASAGGTGTISALVTQLRVGT